MVGFLITPLYFCLLASRKVCFPIIIIKHLSVLSNISKVLKNKEMDFIASSLILFYIFYDCDLDFVFQWPLDYKSIQEGIF